MTIAASIRTVLAALVAAPALSGAAPAAEEPCGLCNRAVVMNSTLKDCFLAEFDRLSSKANGAILVSLTGCERGVVAALPTPKGGRVAPDTEFMLTRTQLACLKRKLEEPGIVLDPSITIPLDRCE